MAHTVQIKTAVRTAFVHQCLSLESACEKYGVNISTGRRWKTAAKKAGDDWEKARSASLMAGQGQNEVLHDVLEKLVILTQSTLANLQETEIDPLAKVEAISRLSDAYNKTASAAAKTNPKLSKLAVAMEVLEKLADFVVKNHPEHTGAFSEVLEPFGSELTRIF